MAMRRAISRLNRADFPTLGRPTIATFGRLFTAPFIARTPGSVLCRVRVAFSLQLAHAIHYVNHARQEREKSSANHNVKQRNKAELQHHPSNRDHLADSRNLTRPPWFDLHFAVEKIQNGGADENDGIARDN